MKRFVVVAALLPLSFSCFAETDEELILSHMNQPTAAIQQVFNDDVAPQDWTLAMQSRWGSTTDIRELEFYKQVQTESTQEVLEVYEKQLHSPSKVNVSQDISAIVKKYADKYNISEDLVVALIQTESAFNPKATSPKGAKGLMQLMDVHSKKNGIDPYDPEENIQVGTKHLASLLYKYNDIKLALAAYNAGEGAVDKYNGVPPYKETKNYVAKIMGLIGE
ncbi:lytic transglycosylase domain-containing protein [Salmonella enterica]|nr:lytic transglycosylase domain-containing protein [Salmonella enterica]